MKLYAFDRANEKAWVFSASMAWLEKHDNGSAISIGFAVPDDISLRQLKSLNAKSVSWEKWKHSGCQSSCVLRGNKECRW
jgi:hypothetical protein